MKKYFLPAASAAILISLTLTSCETPVGQGAGIGAASGALIGAGAAGGRGAAIGAGAGLLAGALVGAAIQSDQEQYYHAPPGGYPYGRPTETPGYVYSPYGNHSVIDVRGIPRGALVKDPSTGGVFRKP
ncbi:MAG TPA: glycine zipper domain-containing protein [Chthoniobacterales bacterium]|jgi:hypothetical protein